MTALDLHAAPTAGRRPDIVLARWLAGVALAAALVELALLRLVTRTAIHIPGIEEVGGAYRVVSTAGRFAFYAADVLVTVTLALLVRALVRRRTRADTWSAAIGAAALVAIAATRVGLLANTTLAVVVAIAVLTTGVRIVGQRPPVAVAVGLFATAFLVSLVHATAQDLAGNGDLRPVSTTGLLLAAETLLLLASVALLRARPTMRGIDIAVGAALAVTVFGAMSASPATSKVVMLWALGLPGYFPAAVYAVAAAVLVSSLLAMMRADRDLAVGLGLLVVGGIGLHTSYQTALVVCGLALVAARTSDLVASDAVAGPVSDQESPATRLSASAAAADRPPADS